MVSGRSSHAAPKRLTTAIRPTAAFKEPRCLRRIPRLRHVSSPGRASDADDKDGGRVFSQMWHEGNATRRGRTLEIIRALAERSGADGGW